MLRSGQESTSTSRTLRGFALSPNTKAYDDFLKSETATDPDVVILSGPQIEGWRNGNFPTSLRRATEKASVVVGTGDAALYLFKEFHEHGVTTDKSLHQLSYLLEATNTDLFEVLPEYHSHFNSVLSRYLQPGLGVINRIPIDASQLSRPRFKEIEVKTDSDHQLLHFINGRLLKKSPVPPLKHFPPYGFGEPGTKSKSGNTGKHKAHAAEIPTAKRNSLTVLGGGTPAGGFNSKAGRMMLETMAGLTVENPIRGTGSRKAHERLKVVYIGIAKGDDKTVDQDLINSFNGVKTSFDQLGISADVQFCHVARPYSEYLNYKKMIQGAHLIILGGGREAVRGPVLVEQKIHKWLRQASKDGTVLAGFSDGTSFLSKGSIGGDQVPFITYGEGIAKVGVLPHSEESIRRRNGEAAAKQGVFKRTMMLGTHTLAIFINGKYRESLLMEHQVEPGIISFDKPPRMIKRVTPDKHGRDGKAGSKPSKTDRPKPMMAVKPDRVSPISDDKNKTKAKASSRSRGPDAKGSARQARRFDPNRKGKGYEVTDEELPHYPIDSVEVPEWLRQFRESRDQIGRKKDEWPTDPRTLELMRPSSPHTII